MTDSPESNDQDRDVLTARIYDELRAIAAACLNEEQRGNTWQPTSLVHEAWLKLGSLEDIAATGKGRFLTLAAQSMRRILIEHARKKKRLKRGGDRRPVASNVVDLASHENLEDVIALHEAIDRLEVEDPRAATVTRLRFYAGLSVEDTAKAMKLSERTVMREWAYARAWLHDALGSVGK